MIEYRHVSKAFDEPVLDDVELTVATGERTVLHTSPISIQAPNWTVDGKSLVFNGSGRLHRLDLATRAVTPFDTGFATRNNNDHVFTFDGTLLGISLEALGADAEARDAYARAGALDPRSETARDGLQRLSRIAAKP